MEAALATQEGEATLGDSPTSATWKRRWVSPSKR
jgi:hypothetical protein